MGSHNVLTIDSLSFPVGLESFMPIYIFISEKKCIHVPHSQMVNNELHTGQCYATQPTCAVGYSIWASVKALYNVHTKGKSSTFSERILGVKRCMTVHYRVGQK